VQQEPRRHGVTPRCILIGLLLMPVNVYWVTVVEVRWYTLDGSCLPLFITPVFMLFALAVLNLLFLRFAPRQAFNQAELLVIYLMVVISETLAGHDFVQNLFGTIGHPFRFATPENRWEELFWQYIPRWLTVSDEIALRGLYEGRESFWQPQMYGPFLVPLAAWGSFLLVLIFVMLCINVLVRKPWTEHEKLSYPLILLPLELTRGQESARFFRNHLMWIGFGIATVIDIVNGCHALWPQIPEIRYIKLYELAQHWPGRPWNATGSTRLGMYPFAIGLAFFLPSDLSFSCWFFYVVSKFERIAGAMMGQQSAQGFPYLNEQAGGAWIGIALVSLWALRGHLRKVWDHVQGLPTDLDDRQEPISYRTAIAGIVLGSVALCIFFGYAGMSPAVTLSFFLIFFLLSVAITRVRAELGTPHEIYFVNPHRLMVQIVGTDALGVRNLTALSVTYWFNRGYRCHPMPCQLEAFKMSEFSELDRKWLASAIMIATVGAIVFSFWANLYITMREGAAARCMGFKSWVGRETYDRLSTWIRSPEPTDYSAIAAMLVGGVIVWALKALRFRYGGLPFHPAGYALAISFAMDYFWFAFFVSWLIKVVLMRYGGQKAHRQGIWFFLGLLAGDYTIGAIWAIIGPAFGVKTYKIFI
jgi:hypothetical protein